MTKDLIGQQLGNYRLVSLLGRGGFAEVYLGQHVRLSKQAAIKVLHAHLSDGEIRGFEQEARTIAELEHPHIVRVLDFDVANGIPFLVMDYCPDGSLRQRHPKGECVPLSTVVSYIKQVAKALQYAHDQRHIHRDIKPENMLIGRHNDILLSDFGIAATAHSTSSMSTQLPVGTIPYIAPEQIQAHARPASDQYALGVVVYEWLCGARPFEGSYTEIFAKHLMTPPPPLHLKVPTLLPDVEQVVLTALAKDPHQRFATILAFATALEQASQPKPPVHGLMPSNTKPSKPELPLPPTVPAPRMVQIATQTELETPVEQSLSFMPKQPQQSQVQAKPQPSRAKQSKQSQMQAKPRPSMPKQPQQSQIQAKPQSFAQEQPPSSGSVGQRKSENTAWKVIIVSTISTLFIVIAGGLLLKWELVSTAVSSIVSLVTGIVLTLTKEDDNGEEAKTALGCGSIVGLIGVGLGLGLGSGITNLAEGVLLGLLLGALAGSIVKGVAEALL
jgi:serine/threonine protein kinase